MSVGTLALDPLPSPDIANVALLPTFEHSLTLSLISRCESTPDQPLFYPCLCKGSIRYVHQVCCLFFFVVAVPCSFGQSQWAELHSNGVHTSVLGMPHALAQAQQQDLM